MRLNIPEGLDVKIGPVNSRETWFIITGQKLYEGDAPLSRNELNPAYTAIRQRLEDYEDLELRGTKILLNGRGQLELNFTKSSLVISQKTASGFFGDTYTKVAEGKYVDPYTNRQSLRLQPIEHEDTLKLIAFLVLEKLEVQATQEAQNLEAMTRKAANDNQSIPKAANDNESPSEDWRRAA